MNFDTIAEMIQEQNAGRTEQRCQFSEDSKYDLSNGGDNEHIISI